MQCFWCVWLQTLSWYVGSVTQGSNVCSSRFISFVAGDRVFSLPGALHKASNAKYLSSPDFRHFNRVLFKVCIVPSTIPFDCENSGLLVSCSKSQFAENFLNSSKGNSGLLSEKTSLRILCLANIAFICSITVDEVLLRSLRISKYLE